VASNKKITDLDEISSITVADDDVLAIVDVSQDKTYKIRKDAFEVAISGVTSMAAGSPLATNASTGSVVLTLNTVPVAKGGTGAITASDARDNLGLGSIATQNANSVAITGGTATLSSATLSTADINGGSIDGATVGATTPSSGSFTTLAASSGYTGSVTGNVTGNVTGSVTGNVTGNITSSGNSTFNTLSTSGRATLNSLTLGGTAITSTGTELNKLDGYTGSATELNYAKSLYDTGVTSTEFDKLDGLTSSTAELNTLDGYTGSATHLNYAKDLYNTGVTTTEFDYLDGVNGTLWHNGNDALVTGGNDSNGYVKLPNGLYIMWGLANISSTGISTVTFPTAFPTYCFTVVTAVGNYYSGTYNGLYGSNWSRSRTGFSGYFSSALPIKTYIAIGI
jgi:hypothetical protein